MRIIRMVAILLTLGILLLYRANCGIWDTRDKFLFPLILIPLIFNFLDNLCGELGIRIKYFPLLVLVCYFLSFLILDFALFWTFFAPPDNFMLQNGSSMIIAYGLAFFVYWISLLNFSAFIKFYVRNIQLYLWRQMVILVPLFLLNHPIWLWLYLLPLLGTPFAYVYCTIVLFQQLFFSCIKNRDAFFSCMR